MTSSVWRSDFDAVLTYNHGVRRHVGLKLGQASLDKRHPVVSRVRKAMELAEFARLPLGDVLVGCCSLPKERGQAMSSNRHHDEGNSRPQRSRLLAPIVVLILTLSAIAGGGSV